MLPENELRQIKKELDECKNPLYIYDKDADGLSSFLLFYKYKKEGHGIPFETKSVDARFAEKVKEYDSDKVFVLDTPRIDIEFVESVSVPIIHIDHHIGGEKLPGVKAYNPRFHDEKSYVPTSSICYSVLNEKNNLWIAAAGTVSDWCVNEITKKYGEEHPEMLDNSFTNPSDAIYKSKIGLIGTILNFMLKGKTADIRKSVNTLLKINGPEEILSQSTDEGKFIYKRYKKINEEYQELLGRAEKEVTESKIFIFKYEVGEMSFSAELSNELMYRHPDKIVIIARKKDDGMVLSLRSRTIEIRDRLLKALEGVHGTGGGHSHAVGANIKLSDFDKFIEQFKEQIEK